MDSLASAMSSECLVTDLVNELSSGLEIPFLLRDDISLTYNQDSTLYEESFKEKFSDDSSFTHSDNRSSFYIKNEIEDDLSCYLKKNNSSNHMSDLSSGNRSGSECSSTEIWMSKNNFDTPPITPPDERISPENIFLLPTDELRFIPISPQDRTPRNSNKIKISVSNKVRIQPKPISTSLNIFDSQDINVPTVICDVFGDMNSNRIKSNTDSNSSLSSNKEKKKSVLSRKDLELLQAKRKQERMIRNRESAYLSRKRKKEHVAHLEKQVQDLLTENNHLRLENYSLRQQLANYEEVDFSSVKKSQSIFTKSPKKATALFALVFIVCLNFGSFSSLINEVKLNNYKVLQNNVIPVYTSEVRHARSLLWSETEFTSKNSTFSNLTNVSCPVFINQSESMRLDSELRRWISGEDDYSGMHNYNISKISQYFYTGDKPKIKKQTSKQKNLKKSSNLQKKNSLEMKMLKMKPNFFNYDTFFEAINRRDDTFYLVSFSGDHLLLPALSHNETSRPKMSLMLPAFLSNVTGAESDQVELMRIDCEVTNTQVFSVNENDIPFDKRSYSNSTAPSESEKKSQKFEDFFLNEEKNFLLPKKPQFKKGIELEVNKNHTSSVKKNKKNPFKPAYNKVMKFLDSQYSYKSSASNGFVGKAKFSANLIDEKIFDNLFSNETNKENSVGFFNNNERKSFLKKLMVSQNLPDDDAAVDYLTNKKKIKNAEGSSHH